MVGLGEKVVDFRVGDRVVYAGMVGPFYCHSGAYAQLRNVPAERLAPIPDGITDCEVAAILLKGSTASLIVNRLFTPRQGDTVLVHTGAAGVGSLLCQWSKHLGATVIGTVGSSRKVEVAMANGCDHVILYRETDLVTAVREQVPDGVAAVFDGVGKDTFLPSLQCLSPFGTAVNYGNASGPVPPIDIQSLASRSLSISRAGVAPHIGNTASLRRVAAELFDLVGRNMLRPTVRRTYALQDAARAHRDIECAELPGAIVLIP